MLGSLAKGSRRRSRLRLPWHQIARTHLLARWNLDPVLLGVANQAGSGIEVPLSPGSDDPDVRLESVVAELKADLVVALAGGAVADGVRAHLERDLDLPLGDERPGDGGAEEVDALVHGVRAKHWENVVPHELLPHVLDEDLLDSESLGLLPGGLDLLALA